MLNRRHLRAKVLEAIFAWQLSQPEIKLTAKPLMQSIDKVNELYISVLSLITETIDFTARDAEERANKHLPTAEDKNPNLKLLNNLFVAKLRENKHFLKAVKDYKINWEFDPEIVKKIFNTLKTSEVYQNYLKNPEHSIEEDKEVIKYIFRKIILKDEFVTNILEDQFLYWTTDRDVMQSLVAKTMKNFTDAHPVVELIPLCAEWEEDSQFAEDLFLQTLKNEATYQKLIADRTQNWDADRIALTDVIIMKLAICEFMNFPSIPVKVTMNEYIDLAKEYSTEKSNSFINGILDKILRDLTQNNQIVKTGRGLAS